MTNHKQSISKMTARSQRVMAKAAQRRRAHNRPQPMSFSALANDRLYCSIAEATCPDHLSDTIAQCGFESAAQVAACETVNTLKARMPESVDREGFDQSSLQTLLAQAKQEAKRSYRIMRHMVAVNDPMNQGLNDTQSALLDFGDDSLPSEPINYAKPASLQSNQSLAAYLQYLYRIATGMDQELGVLCDEDSPYAIHNRRPDLAQLTLNQSNLKQEIPTLELVNEVLRAGLSDINLSKSFYPLALPYDHASATAHTALRQLAVSINDIGSRTDRLSFDDFTNHRWAKDQAGLLGLTGTTDQASSEGSTVSLLIEEGSTASASPLTLDALYNTMDLAQASQVDYLKASLELDFDGLAQLFGLYVVSQENGEPVAQRNFATAFLANEEPFEVTVLDDIKSIHISAAPLNAPTLRSVNYLARLHHSTGLAFHHLNLLLNIPGASASSASAADEARSASQYLTDTGLRLLASYSLYRDSYGLTPEAYAALFSEISPHWRADEIVAGETAVAGLEQTEVSFLATLFDQHAPYVHTVISIGSTSINDPELRSVIARGLSLSALELETLIAALDADFALTTAIDARGLGALYRLATLSRMLGWSLLSGMALIATVSQSLGEDDSLWAVLITRNETASQTDSLCCAMDWLVAFSEWMKEAELTPEQLIELLTPAQESAVPAVEEDRAWLNDLAIDFQSSAVSPETFNNFEIWQDSDITAETWQKHLSSIDPVIRSSGVFLPNTNKQTIEDACHECLLAAEVDPKQDTNASQLQNLVLQLTKLYDAQRQMMLARVAALDPNISIVSAESLINWSQISVLGLLETLLPSPSQSTAEQEPLFWLSEIKRHIAVTNSLELGDIDLWLLGNKPHWLAPDIAGGAHGVQPLNLSQLFELQRFASVQIGPANDAAWRGYLALSNEQKPASESAAEELTQWTTGCRQTLALLMGCPAQDMAVYIDALFGINQVATDITQVDKLAQHIRLADELCISAKELLAIKAVSDSSVSGDWSAAASAAQAGLARFQDGAYLSAFHKRLAEVERDALVAAFMQSKIAGNEGLRDEITDSEKLYSYLLLDVNVASAVPTSRLVEATNSLQLFISRALAGLEPDIHFTDSRRENLAAQWELDKHYRQWEANQKLLLYPQNYIEPELRYITSPEFDNLRQTVSGSDVSPDSVESAVNAYMNGLASACDLSVCSFYAQRGTEGMPIENVKYHVLAKAKWEPGRFFYRKLDADYQTIAELSDQSQYLKAMDWTYWQEVSIPKTFEMFSDVTVCVFKNRYYFFWLELEERRLQTPDGTISVWRLHPRYMRCDQNALVGPMLTPGMFIAGQINDSSDTLTLDGAFQWSGSKPALNGTYHPTRAPDGLVYGELNTLVSRDSNPKETFTVTFGINLVGVNSAGQETLQEGSLCMRLSEEWSDAIVDLNTAIITEYEEEAPSGYSSIYPTLVLEKNAVAAQYTLISDYDPLKELEGSYSFQDISTGNVITAYNQYKSGSSHSSAVFIPAQKGSLNLGSVDIGLDLGERIYHIQTRSKSLNIALLQEGAETTISVRFILEYSKEGSDTKVFETSTEFRRTSHFRKESVKLALIDPHYGFYGATLSHPTDEQFIDKIVLPDDWSFDGKKQAGLKVKAEVSRYFSSMTIVVNGRPETTYPKSSPVRMALDLGTFDLRPPSGKNNSAWVQTGEHGNRNFMHVTDKENRTNDQTFVLSNSSSVLSKLAKTMPRPGGCESLFKPENQEQIESFGSFFEDFPATLDAIYTGDTTELDEGRKPDAYFDFDSAYGAYGWEVFYYIPAAIAGGYASSGQFDLALQWLHKIFDPQLEIPWRVKPLANASVPLNGLAFDTGDVTVDPDRIARDYPFYYQQASIRHYLEILLEAGDAAYEDQTQESLQTAKALYVSAKQLFSDSLPETLESLSNTPWLDPTLATAAEEGFDGFLPPYNDELKDIHGTLQARLFNLRHWLDLHGEPLNVSLLAQPIDPQQLQRSARSALLLRGADAEEAEQTDPPLDFAYVVKSAKGYLNNLKLTSHRLQDANEKESSSQLEEFRMDAAIGKAGRAIDLHDLTIAGSEKEVAIRQAKVVTSTAALASHIGHTLAQSFTASSDAIYAARARLGESRVLIRILSAQISGTLKSTIPNTFGFSNGGQNLEQADVVWSILKISHFLYGWDADAKSKAAKTSWAEWIKLASQTEQLTSQLAVSSLELQKANIALNKDKAMREELETRHGGATLLREEWDGVFGGTSFYKPFREDLEALYAEEWAATQEFCRLLVRLYEDETQLKNGATFLRTTSLGSGVTKYNAPHRLALDIERLETSYIQAVLDQVSDTSEVEFALSDVPAMGLDISALEALATQGEAYFELNDEMFDLFYPGQYDRRIQSINIAFPGLAKASLNPHARLTQVSNTRYITDERSLAKGAKIRKDKHALQSLLVGACEVDSQLIDAPDGLLKRFQNTGVSSSWHLVIPSVWELKQAKTNRSRAWRSAATERYDALKPHLSEVLFKVRFSGRW